MHEPKRSRMIAKFLSLHENTFMKSILFTLYKQCIWLRMRIFDLHNKDQHISYLLKLLLVTGIIVIKSD